MSISQTLKAFNIQGMKFSNAHDLLIFRVLAVLYKSQPSAELDEMVQSIYYISF